MQGMGYEVRFIRAGWQHHSDHSGYEKLIEQLGCAIEPLELSQLRSTVIPGRVAVWFAARSGVRYYSYVDFYNEWAAARTMLHNGGRTIYHVLNGDVAYRYLGSFARFSRSCVVATYHQPPTWLRESLKSVDHLRRLHGIIVVGTSQIPFFEPIVGAERIFWVPLGLDTSVFRPRSSSQQRSTAGSRGLFVGMHMRDFETLRRVIELVHTQDKQMRFTVVTDQSNLSFFVGLDNVDVRCRIAEPELIELCQGADFLLQPLQDSTANTAILEALSCGLPVIATDVGSVRDYLDETCGVLVPAQDAEAMASAVLDLSRDESKRRQMVTSARRRALQFDWSIVVERLRQAYAQVLAQT